MSPSELAAALYDYVLEESTGGTSDTASPRMKAAAARCITGALQEMIRLRADLFSRPFGWNINAPSSGTVTIDSGAPSVITGSSGITFPNSGCTIRLGGASVDSRTFVPASGSKQLDVPFVGPFGSVGATLYHDAVLIHRGTARGTGEDKFSAAIREARFNNRPLIACQRRADAEARLMVGRDYGAAHGRSRLDVLPAGDPAYCWVEPYAVDRSQVEMRLRLAPLPASSGVLEVEAVISPASLTASDLDSDSGLFAVPGELDETVLLPFALQRWMATPWCRPTAMAASEIGRQFREAKQYLKTYRKLGGAGPVAVATTQ